MTINVAYQIHLPLLLLAVFLNSDGCLHNEHMSVVCWWDQVPIFASHERTHYEGKYRMNAFGAKAGLDECLIICHIIKVFGLFQMDTFPVVAYESRQMFASCSHCLLPDWLFRSGPPKYWGDPLVYKRSCIWAPQGHLPVAKSPTLDYGPAITSLQKGLLNRD